MLTPRKQTSTAANQKCCLVDISSFYLQSKLPPDITKVNGFTFLINPVELQRSLTASYSTNQGIGAQNQYLQYTGSKRNSVSLQGCIIDSRCYDSDLQQYTDQLEQLIFVPANTTPKILALTFASRIIQPIVLTELSITETAWANGYLSRGTFDLTFEYVQPANLKPRITQDPKPTKREAAKKNPAPKPQTPEEKRRAKEQADFTRILNGR